MTPLDFCNNLRKGDAVLDVESNRPAKVARQPAETGRMVCVCYQGTASDRYVDVMRLRLVVNGKAEDVPPVDAPEKAPPLSDHQRPTRAAAPSAPAAPTDALTILRARKQAITDEITGMENRCRELRAEEKKVDTAITALSA